MEPRSLSLSRTSRNSEVMEEVLRRLAELTTRQQKFNEHLAGRQEKLEQAFTYVAEIMSKLPPTKLTDLDDIKAYLHTFEVIARREAWNKTDWVRILTPFLTGEAHTFPCQPRRTRTLRCIMAEDGSDWDLMLPYVLFGVREVPQASTGFTPFERQPRGLLDVARQGWEQQPAPHRSVQQMKTRIDRVMPLVREHVAEAQHSQRWPHYRLTQPRVFQPGDWVLIRDNAGWNSCTILTS